MNQKAVQNSIKKSVFAVLLRLLEILLIMLEKNALLSSFIQEQEIIDL